MTKRTVHIKTIRLFAALVLLLSAVACTREEWSDCDPTLQIRFSFYRNPSGTERFSEEVTRLDVFIFDNNGLFVKSLSDQRANFPENYVMEAELPREGNYTIVAVGNADNTFQIGRLVDYLQGCAQLQPGVSTLADFRLMHKQVGSISADKICDIFNGTAEVKGLKTEVIGDCKVVLTKNTKTLDVTVSGLGNVATRALYPTIKVEAHGCNGVYMFNNDHDEAAPDIIYIPFARAIEGANLKVKFSVLRLFTHCPMPLVITHKGSEVGNFNLIAEILKSPDFNSDDDLDNEDTFKIDITFDTAGSLTIKVNGWQTTGSGGIVGRACEQIKSL